MNKVRKCFTINIYRTPAEVDTYAELLRNKSYDACEVFNPYNLEPKRQAEYKASMLTLRENRDIEFVLHMPFGKDSNLASHNNIDSIMKRMYESIEWAKKLDCHKLTLHAGEFDGTLSRDEAISLSITNVQKIAEYAAKYDMTVMMENLVDPQELCLSPEEMDEYLRLVNRKNVKFIFDCGHANASGHPDLASYVYAFKKMLWHLHLNDNLGSNDDHFLLGDGKIDFIPYFKALKAVKFQGLFCVEVFHKSAQDLVNQAEIIDRLWEEASKK
jgi:sugar phosphate isomerase/epimerase